MPEHIVRQGECLSSIADSHGLFWQTIWNDAQNASLKRQRQDPNVLLPGDRVFVPDKREKQESGGTEQRHRFRKKGTPAKLKIRLLLDDKPRANLPYRLCIDGLWRDGMTDGDGFVVASIPPNAQQGKIIIKENNVEDEYEFALGTVDPLDTDDGVRARLSDLGYDTDGDLSQAVREFQNKNKLQATGVVDAPTRSKLKEGFGQ